MVFMKKKHISIIIIFILLLIIVGCIVLNYYLSNYMFDETGFPHFQSRKDNLIELRTFINTNIHTEEEKNEFINNCLEQNQITRKEADFLLGVTDKL